MCVIVDITARSPSAAWFSQAQQDAYSPSPHNDHAGSSLDKQPQSLSQHLHLLEGAGIVGHVVILASCHEG